MKKIILLSLTLITLMVSFASSPINPSIKEPKKLYASTVMIPLGSSGKSISLMELSKISRGGLERLTGKKMNFLQRFAFRSGQNKIKKGINRKGVVTNNNLAKAFEIDGTTGFHLGGFALGLFLFLIGVLIAYLIDDDKKRNRVKWAWIGAGTFIILGFLLFAAAYSGSFL
ncbi:MAG: hypothetical protein ABIO05_03350 [Ferruginibacter sp.]